MPIYLRPISRRRFLSRAAAAGAGLALNPELLAASATSDPHSWALLSDPHLAADPTTVSREVNMADHFMAVARQLLALPKRPAGAFINGDCAYNTGQIADYALLAELLQPIRTAQIPIHLALGNHDHRERFWQALPEERAALRPLNNKQATLVRAERANWFVLDSLDETLSTPGLIGQLQLDWLANALDSNRDKPALVLAHHNPGTSGTVSGLKDTPALFELLRRRKQVKAYFFGHTHTWNVQRDPSGIQLVNLPAVAYPFQPGQPSGWVHANLRRQGLQLKLWCIDPAHHDHGQVVNLSWRA